MLGFLAPQKAFECCRPIALFWRLWQRRQVNTATRRRKTIDPCQRCGLHRDRCICDQIPLLTLRTRVSLVIHARELKRTTNTGRLLMHALANSSMWVRGQQDLTLDLSDLLSPDYEPVLLYPAPDAIEISKFCVTRPVNLIVPDGNWRQAGKVHLRHRELADIPRVKIDEANPNAQHLRREHFSEGYSTLQAAALALRHLEGEVVYQSLNDLYLAKLNATIQGRPKRRTSYS